MSDIIDEFKKKIDEEFLAKGREEGRKEHAYEVAVKLVKTTDFSAEQITDLSALPLEDVEGIIKAYR